MKKYLVLVVCISLIIGVLLVRESYFEVKNAEIKPISIKDKKVEMIFVGDIMLGRNVENLILAKGRNYPFEHVGDFLKSVDAVVANLEGPIMSKNIKTPSMSFSFSFASSSAKLMAENNIWLVSQANNHGFDYGESGYKETQNHLKESGIFYVGHPYDFKIHSVSRQSINGVDFLFVAFNLTSPSFNIEEALNFVKKIESKDKSFVVALVHGGDEYVLKSNNLQKKMYRGLIDNGVDLVIAHHPHVVEEIEVYKKKAIFYSLGNFIFDQYFSKDVQDQLAVKMTLSDYLVEYELVPVLSVRSQPEIMSSEAKKGFLSSLAQRSSIDTRRDITNGRIILPR